MDNRAIGIFDSGIGGLTVVKEVMKQLPNEQIVYFGDTARVPYGGKSKETITKYSKQIIKFLLSQNVKAVIVACNTASSNSLLAMKAEFKLLPIIGVVEPGAFAAANATKNYKIGIIGTEATVKSGAYEKHIGYINQNIKLYLQPCPLFVSLVEEGWTDGQIPELIAKKYLDDLIDKGIDTLVLGCTHYPLMSDCIKKVVGENIYLVNPAIETASELKTMLDKLKLFRQDNRPVEHKFYMSDTSPKFEQLSMSLFGKIYIAKKIDIDT